METEVDANKPTEDQTIPVPVTEAPKVPLPPALEQEFMKIRKALIEKYQAKLNTKEENDHLAKLMSGDIIVQSYALHDSHPDAPIITFRSLNQDILDFITRISMLNIAELRNAPPDRIVTPKVDESYRLELMMAAATVQLRDKEFSDLSNVRDRVKSNTIKELIGEMEDRSHEIKELLHPVLYNEATCALVAWLQHLTSLLTPEKVENF